MRTRVKALYYVENTHTHTHMGWLQVCISFAIHIFPSFYIAYFLCLCIYLLAVCMCFHFFFCQAPEFTRVSYFRFSFPQFKTLNITTQHDSQRKRRWNELKLEHARENVSRAEMLVRGLFSVCACTFLFIRIFIPSASRRAQNTKKEIRTVYTLATK